MTIIHHPRSQLVRVVGARRPVYKVYHGDGFGNTVAKFFSTLAPKAIPMAKQLGMKAIGVIGERVAKPVGDLASGIATSVKERILRLIRPKPIPAIAPTPVVLPATEEMPLKVATKINSAVNKKIAELSKISDDVDQGNIVANMIAGNGLRFRR